MAFPTTDLTDTEFAKALGGTANTDTVATVWASGAILFHTGEIVYDLRDINAALASTTSPAKIDTTPLQYLGTLGFEVVDGGGTGLGDATGAPAVSAGTPADPDTPWWCLVRRVFGSNKQPYFIHQSNLWTLAQVQAAVGSPASDNWTDPTPPPFNPFPA
jgi:hypothetical protein